MATSALRLYTLNNLVSKLHLTHANKYPEGIAIELVAGSYSGPPKRRIDLGEPIVHWVLSEAKDRREEIVLLMRKWCEIEPVNLRLRPLDSGEFYRWKTNTPPEWCGGFHSTAGVERALEALKRPVETLALAGIAGEQPDLAWKFWRPLIEFLEMNGQLSFGSLPAWDSRAQGYIDRNHDASVARRGPLT